MTPKRKKRLALVLFVVIGAASAVGLAAFALNQNISLFYSPKQIASGEAPVNKRIRAGGMVVEGSVKRSTQGLKVEFALTDYAETVNVVFEGILPDLFREGQGIVAQGSLDENGVLQAVEVLAKHDEKYMPPEVTDALEKAAADKIGKQMKASGTYPKASDNAESATQGVTQ